MESSFTYQTKMRKAVLLLMIIFLFPCRARADTPPFPNISGWKIISNSRIEVRLSEKSVAYLGLDVEYQNPSDKNEFIRVVSRHIPLILIKRKYSNKPLLNETVLELYATKEERDRLEELSKNSDPIIYVRWRLAKDPRTGKSIRNEDVDVWFLESSGEWIFTKNEPIYVQFLSENVSNGKTQNFLVGRLYRVGNSVHMIKVDRDDLRLLFDKEK